MRRLLALLLVVGCQEAAQDAAAPDDARHPTDADTRDAIETDASEDLDGGGCIGGDAEPLPDAIVDAGSIDSSIDSSIDGSIDGSIEDIGSDAGRADAGITDAATSTCPADMVAVEQFCIDRYEASRSDATATNVGFDESIATSRPGVLPWYVTTATTSVLAAYQAACVVAGKRLCTSAEWFEACNGPQNTFYSFGNTFEPETCNCVDTNCDDYCRDNLIDLSLCNTSTNCGYNCGLKSPPSNIWCFTIKPTGSFSQCESAYGAFDINGNVWEMVPSTSDPRGYEIRGGAFNCAHPATRLLCAYNAPWNALFAGFRCCKDRP